MAYYYGVIYFKDGTKVETNSSNDERSAERQTAMEFDQYMRTAELRNDNFHKPTRYEIKSK